MKKALQQEKRTTRPVVFDMTSNLCVWSRAGVIKPTACMNAFDCLGCGLDRKLKREIAEGRLKAGRALAGFRVSDKLPYRSAEERKCRHMLSGLVSVKYCVNDYNCDRCEYHQMVEEERLSEGLGRPDQEFVSGFALAKNYYFHRGHSWARVEHGGRVRVGLDDFASRIFGPADAFRLPKLGDAVLQSEPGFSLIREDKEADCLSPVEGTVVAVNPKAAREKPTGTEDPYGAGWLMVVEPVKLRTSLRNLLFERESRLWLEEEVARLTALISGDRNLDLAATGGRALTDIYGKFPYLGWERYRREFLLT